MRIPFYSLKHQHDEIREKAERSFSRVFQENWFILGDHVKNFENNFTAYLGARYCAGLGNGFDAIFIALKALGIGPGDEVIVPAHTCIATWLAVGRTGAVIRAVDVDPHSWLMGAGKVGTVLSTQTKAIVPVHLYGFPCDMKALNALAIKNNLKIVEDNAQAAGAFVGGKRTGTWGHCNAFSFYPTKNLGALGDGGAVVTDDENVYHLAQAYRNYGARLPYLNELQGINSRLDELQAAFLNLKLQQLDRWNMKRRDIAGWYKENLKGMEAVALPQVVEGAEPVYHIFPIRARKRDQLQRYLLDRGIETLVHYPVPPYKQKAYMNFDSTNSFPVADQIAQTELSLPIWPGLEREAVEEICGLIRKFFQ